MIISKLARILLLKKWQQLGWIFFVSLMTLGITYLIEYFDLMTISLSRNNFIDFTSYFAQLNGILASFLIGFLFFSFQSKESKKLTYYFEFRKVVDTLIEKLKNLPFDAKHLSSGIGGVLDVVDSKQLDDFPFKEDDWKKIIKNAKKIKDDKISNDTILRRELLSLFAKIETYASQIGIVIVGFWLSSFLIDSIKKQIVLLAINISLMFTAKVTNLSFQYVENLGLFLVLSIGMLTIIGFFELLFYVLDYYENVLDEKK